MGFDAESSPRDRHAHLAGFPGAPEVRQADISQFIRFKAYDMIGRGEYKKFVTTSKDQQQPWAVEMHNSVAQVVSAQKALLVGISALKTMEQDWLHSFCTCIVESSVPPCKVFERYSQPIRTRSSARCSEQK